MAIVIDFDEFAVFDCRIRPRPAGKQIDQLAGELYGLTDDEIRIVEEATT